MDRHHRLRAVGARIADPAETLAQAIAERATDVIVQAVDVNALLARVDPNAILNRVDVDALLARVDVDALLDRADIARLLERVDVGKIVQKIDMNELIAGIDVGAVADRVDVNQIAQRIDVDRLVEQTDLGAIIARSSGGIASGALDMLRRQAVGLDEFIARWAARLLRRRYPGPPGPPQLAAGPVPAAALPQPAVQASLQGRYAGAASRFVAYLVDATVSSGVFMLALTAISYAASLITGHTVTWSQDSVITGIMLAGWEFTYYAYSWATSGKTPGMALLGLRVVQPPGAPLRPSAAIIRTLAFPFSFLLLGLGFIGILVQRDRRALHDLAAGTVVSYDWDAQAARYRFLARTADARPQAAGRNARSSAMPGPSTPQRGEPD